MTKTNIPAGALFATVLIAVAGVASISVATAEPSPRSARSSRAAGVDRAQQSRSTDWRTAQDALPLQFGLEVDVNRSRCRYLGGPKSSIPC
jgi:hypothetical protein